jgi:hypothetical protein
MCRFTCTHKTIVVLSLTVHVTWNRETEEKVRVGPGRPEAQKAIDKTTAGFAG